MTYRDADIASQCQSACIDEAKECQSECQSNDCISICIDKLTKCDNSCPCGSNCPLGCIGCDHELCQCNPDKNPDSIECVHFLEEQFVACIDVCSISDKAWV